jgi:protein-tyrosine-phosphatase
VSVFRIAFVCSGNRFRSPLAEHALRRALDNFPVEIQSLGTLELGSMAALPEAIVEGKRLGLDLGEHRSRSLAGADLSTTDLVVGFERLHLRSAVVEAKATRDRTFTLPELVGLLDGLEAPASPDPAQRARALVTRAAARRPSDPHLLSTPEVPDPLGRSGDDQRRIADNVQQLADSLARALFVPAE